MIINKQDNKTGLYIHIPFCAKKCGYCDFLSFDSCDSALQQDYVTGLIKELSLYHEQRIPVDTVFIGGGTPSVLSEEWICRIMEAVKEHFVLLDGERTIEANPGTLSPQKLQAYRKAGLNRLSMGVQSLNDDLLLKMGRIHTAEEAMHNFLQAREAGFTNINLDLMFGLPGQPMEDWTDTLDKAINLRPEHISFYSLQLEEGTEFYKLYQKDKLQLPDDIEDRKMYHKAIRMLRAAGYEHYEISNSALNGKSCVHNLKYWSMIPYIGIGLGAHSFSPEQGRCCNTDNIATYLTEVQKGNLPVDYSRQEPYTIQDAMSEYVFTGLRKIEGISLTDFRYRFGQDFFQVFEEAIQAMELYKNQGCLKMDFRRIALTEEGLDISNKIMAEFV